MSTVEKVGLGFFMLYVAIVGAWLTHIFYCIKVGNYLLLIAGGLVAPVGVVHGISVWFGAPWG